MNLARSPVPLLWDWSWYTECEGSKKMAKSVIEIVEEYLSEDPKRWAKLASEVNWRRLELLLLREILLELKKLNQANLAPPP
jgi:hypothetical protein